MNETRKITAEVDADLLTAAVEIVGEDNISETVRVGLLMIVEGRAPEAEAMPEVAAAAETAALPAMPVRLAAEMSSADVAKWKREFTRARLTLVKAKAKLAARHASLNTGTQEKKRLTIKIADLDGQINKIRLRAIAFAKGSVSMPAPTAAVLGNIGKLVAEVEQQTAAAAKADAILAATLALTQALGAA